MADTAAGLRSEFEAAKVERRDHIRASASRLHALGIEVRPPVLNVWAARWKGRMADQFNVAFVPRYDSLTTAAERAQSIGTGYLGYINANL